MDIVFVEIQLNKVDLFNLGVSENDLEGEYSLIANDISQLEEITLESLWCVLNEHLDHYGLESYMINEKRVVQLLNQLS